MATPRVRPTWQPGDVREAGGGLFALALATFVAITTELVPVGLLPLISDDLDVSEGVAGLLVTAYAFMVAVLAVPLTTATRKLPRKTLLLTALGVYVLSNVIVAVAPTFALVAVARTLGGASHAVFFSVSIGYASRLVRAHLAGRALGLVTLGASAGFVLGVPLTTALGTAVGWRAAFLVLAVACTLAGVLTALVLPSVPGGGAPPDDAARGARRTALAKVTTANALAYLGHYTVYTYVSVLLLATGLATAALGPALLLIGALGLIGAGFAAARLDVRPRQTTVITLVVVAGGILALGLAFPGTAGTLAAAAVWSIGFGAVAAVFQAAAIRTRGASPDVVGALVNSTANIGIGGGAALGALVLDGAGFAAVPYTGAVIVVAALLVVLVARQGFPATQD
ncbi:putative arabinose efflux permease, MFS family [Promicromonospora umidemergens]|uniref:MFS transporter n=1 Tax=Promicromonospora umidemergens TaxID=629679 RepID=A0ABP8WFB1_9MICO|nr:MFS transporter [Promicromonospora umidemergens]MCP2284098.1 putative arabinose efflux permease, MFS family [Promicromonospora umidemergens]